MNWTQDMVVPDAHVGGIDGSGHGQEGDLDEQAEREALKRQVTNQPDFSASYLIRTHMHNYTSPGLLLYYYTK